MSTVSKFVQLLEDIGYSAGPATAAKPPPGRPSSVKARALGQQTSQSSGNKTISADSLEWMFLSEDSTKPFLQWFCSNITKRNFVSADQLERYEALRDQLRTIDSPTDLQAALKQAGKTKSNDVELDELKAEIASLEHQLSTSKDELKELVWQRDIMQNQLRAAQRRTEDVRSLIKLRDNEFGVTHLPRLDQANQRLNKALHQVSAATSGLLSSLKVETAQQLTSSTSRPFLYMTSIANIIQREEEFATLMQYYVDRAVNTGTDRNSDSPVTHRDLSAKHDPTTIPSPINWLQGVDAETHIRQMKEVARLQAFFPAYEMERINAELALTKKRAIVETLKTLMTKQRPNAQENKDRLTELRKQLIQLKAMNSKALDTTVNNLVLDLAKLQSTPILWGDYSLKIARQHFSIYKQNKTITNLLQQLSRQSVLSLAISREQKEVAGLFAMLASLYRELQTDQQAFQRRMKQLQTSTLPLNTLLDQCLDTNSLLYSEDLQSIRLVMLALLKHLAPVIGAGSTSQQHILTTLTTKLKEAHESATKRLQVQRQTIEAKLEKTSQHVETLNKALHAEATTQTPELSSSNVIEAQRKLDTSVTALTSAMERIVKEHQAKQKMLSSASREKQIERNLFTYFFADSDNLKALLRELERRVEARSVKAK